MSLSRAVCGNLNHNQYSELNSNDPCSNVGFNDPTVVNGSHEEKEFGKSSRTDGNLLVGYLKIRP